MNFQPKLIGDKEIDLYNLHITKDFFQLTMWKTLSQYTPRDDGFLSANLGMVGQGSPGQFGPDRCGSGLNVWIGF